MIMDIYEFTALTRNLIELLRIPGQLSSILGRPDTVASPGRKRDTSRSFPTPTIEYNCSS